MEKNKEMRGRPASSPIRQNIVELLYFVKKGYGYDLYKKYTRVFEQKISMRSVYYHLNKGVETGELRVHEVEAVKGDYSWGDQVKRIVFTLGPNARPKGNRDVLNKLQPKK